MTKAMNAKKKKKKKKKAKNTKKKQKKKIIPLSPPLPLPGGHSLSLFYLLTALARPACLCTILLRAM